MAAARRFAHRVHTGRISRELGVAVAALLIGLPAAAQDIAFNPAITQQDFSIFSRLVAQGIFATPVEPARATSLISFDVGVGATALKINTHANYWVDSVPSGSNFVHGDYAAAPRVIVSKGLGFATLTASYAKFSGSDVKTWGGTLDLPIIRGTLATPELAVRAAYAELSGVDVLKLRTYGLEAFVSKGFGPFTPYVAYGVMRTDSTGSIASLEALHCNADDSRWTLGFRLSFLVPKISVEATQAVQRSYAAKISVGF